MKFVAIYSWKSIQCERQDYNAAETFCKYIFEVLVCVHLSANLMIFLLKTWLYCDLKSHVRVQPFMKRGLNFIMYAPCILRINAEKVSLANFTLICPILIAAPKIYRVFFFTLYPDEASLILSNWKQIRGFFIFRSIKSKVAEDNARKFSLQRFDKSKAVQDFFKASSLKHWICR